MLEIMEALLYLPLQLYVCLGLGSFEDLLLASRFNRKVPAL